MLDFQSWEIATVAALTGMEGVESQLKSHLNISLNGGLTCEQLNQLAGVLEKEVGLWPAERIKAGLQ